MKEVAGDIVIKKSDGSMLDHLTTILTLLDGVAIATHVTSGTPYRTKPGDYLAAELRVQSRMIKLPLAAPFMAAINGQTPDEIHLSIVPSTKSPDYSKWISGLASPFMQSITPSYVNYYEEKRGSLEDTFGKSMDSWPTGLLFARHVRNALSHGGKLDIRNPNCPIASWRGLSYSSTDNGRQIIGTDLLFPDLLALMLDFHGEVTG